MLAYLQIGFEWIMANTDLIALLASILLVFVETLRATGELRQGLLALMLRAEKAVAEGEFGPNVSGPQIMDKVVAMAMERVVPKLPRYLRVFVTESVVRWLAHRVYEYAKRYLKDGKLLPEETTEQQG